MAAAVTSKSNKPDRGLTEFKGYFHEGTEVREALVFQTSEPRDFMRFSCGFIIIVEHQSFLHYLHVLHGDFFEV
jgi:hypothetical protein